MTDVVHVGIVDDNIAFRKALSVLIGWFSGYSVLMEAGNGKELIIQLEQGTVPDIILLDISMPIMDGYQTAEWLLRHHPQIKVLVLSTMEAEWGIIRMIRYGAKGYVLKDADHSVLKLALDTVLYHGFFYHEVEPGDFFQKAKCYKHELEPLAANNLTGKELQFLQLICSELTYEQIGSEMLLSPRMIDIYRTSLYEKLGVQSRIGLVLYAINHGIAAV